MTLELCLLNLQERKLNKDEILICNYLYCSTGLNPEAPSPPLPIAVGILATNWLHMPLHAHWLNGYVRIDNKHRSYSAINNKRWQPEIVNNLFRLIKALCLSELKPVSGFTKLWTSYFSVRLHFLRILHSNVTQSCYFWNGWFLIWRSNSYWSLY